MSNILQTHALQHYSMFNKIIMTEIGKLYVGNFYPLVFVGFWLFSFRTVPQRYRNGCTGKPKHIGKWMCLQLCYAYEISSLENFTRFNVFPIWKIYIIHETTWLMVHINYILDNWEVILFIAMLRLYGIKNSCLFFWMKEHSFINLFLTVSSLLPSLSDLMYYPDSVILKLAPFATLSTSWMSRKRKTCPLESKMNKKYD